MLKRHQTGHRFALVLAGIFLLALTAGGCGQIEELEARRAEEAAQAQAEREALEKRISALDAEISAAEIARVEAEEEARIAEEALADAKEDLAAAERARVEERDRLLRTQETMLAEQARQRQEQERLAARLESLESREQELLERERDLEAREINLEVAEDELESREAAAGFRGPPSSAESSGPRSLKRAALQPGQVFEVEILETLSSRTHRLGDRFAARTVQDLRAEDGTLVIPAGSEVVGEVTEVTPLRGLGGQASIAVEFTRMIAPSGEALEIRAGFLEMGAERRGNKKKVIGAAVAGAILGRVLGGKGAENAVVGAVVGAAAGGAVAARARDKDAVIPAGEIVAMQLEEVVTVDVEMTGPVDDRR
jgi:hypothetical protein